MLNRNLYSDFNSSTTLPLLDTQNLPKSLSSEALKSKDFSKSDTDLVAVQNSILNINNAPWFWGTISREEEAEELHGKPDGSFLVRNSSTSSGYTLSLCHERTIKLIRIYQKGGKFGFELSDLPFDSVVDLINFYADRSLKQYNLNLDVKLKYAVVRNAFENDEEDSDNISLTNKNKHAGRNGFASAAETSHDRKSVELIIEYGRVINHCRLKSQAYDEYYQNFASSTQDLLNEERGLKAAIETLKMFEEQKICLERTQQNSPSHEKKHLEENLHLLLERRAYYSQCKEKIESRIKTLKLNQETAERQLAAVKPDLVPLHKRREALQRLLEARGLNDETVEKILDAQTGRKNGTTTVTEKPLPKLGSDYIPPQGVLEVVDHWLMKPSSSKQEAWNCLMQNSEKSFDGKKFKVAKDGTFLIRPSETKPGFYALSVVCKQKIQNCMIEKKVLTSKFSVADDLSCVPPAQQLYTYGFEGTEKYFASLSDLVKYYSYNSLKSHNQDLDVTLMHPALLNRSQQ